MHRKSVNVTGTDVSRAMPVKEWLVGLSRHPTATGPHVNYKFETTRAHLPKRASSALYTTTTLIQKYVLVLFGEVLRGLFQCCGPCQWTRLVSGNSAAAVSHQRAITLAMVCTCSPIRTVAITTSSRFSYTFYECFRRRTDPLWRFCKQISVSKQ
jgi:hypothetical protein